MCPNLISNHLNVAQLSPPTKYDFGLPVMHQMVWAKRLEPTEQLTTVHLFRLSRDWVINKMSCKEKGIEKNVSTLRVTKINHFLSHLSLLRQDKYSSGVSQNVVNSMVWEGKIVFCACGGINVISLAPPKLRRNVVLFKEFMVESKSNFVLQKTLSLLISKLSLPTKDMLLLVIFNFVGLKFDFAMVLLAAIASKSSSWCFIIFFE